MKTYCKPRHVNVENEEFNSVAVHRAFIGKLAKDDFCRLLISTGKITAEDLSCDRAAGVFVRIIPAIDHISKEFTNRIVSRNLMIGDIKSFRRMDGISMKTRDLNKETPEQQIFEYIAHNALRQLFDAKILPSQCGSIPGRGQIACKRQTERILRKKFGCGPVDEVKCDIRHAYQSVTVECVMKLLRRDIRKNKVLLWFIGAVMENYPDGRLMIGGYLSTWLFNYVMSYVLRHISSLRKSRRGVSTKMVVAIVCYADDFSCYGSWSNLRRAIKSTTKWAKTTLGIEIKEFWNISKVSSFDSERSNYAQRKLGSRKRTCGVDIAGFVIYRTYTIIRGRIFVRMRRQIIRALRDLNKLGYIPWWRAAKICSYYGWIVNTDSHGFQKMYDVKRVIKFSKLSVSMVRKARLSEVY